jgi:hypothetical protein
MSSAASAASNAIHVGGVTYIDFVFPIIFGMIVGIVGFCVFIWMIGIAISQVIIIWKLYKLYYPGFYTASVIDAGFLASYVDTHTEYTKPATSASDAKPATSAPETKSATSAPETKPATSASDAKPATSASYVKPATSEPDAQLIASIVTATINAMYEKKVDKVFHCCSCCPEIKKPVVAPAIAPVVAPATK